MRVFATISIVLAMAFHATLGCCWHHAHERHNCNEHAMSVASPEANDCHADHCSSHADHDADVPPADSDSPAPCDRSEPCDELDCVFLRTDTGPSLHDIFSDSFFALALDASPAATNSCDSCSDFLSHDSLRTPPLRAHLMLQVFLI